MLARGIAFSAPRAPFQGIEYELSPAPHEVIVQVAGCGLCHTDVGFYFGDVAPRAKLPLVLGHEISGTVVGAGARFESLIGTRVIVPAVMPCGDCPHCRAGYENTCTRQFMPGNDGHGGFATHICVPGRYVAPLPADLGPYSLPELSVIADAVTTPYQSVLRSGLRRGDVAIVVGAGGIGTYGVQIAAAFGARVLAIDIDDAKLARLRDFGAAATFNSRGHDLKTARAAVRKLAAGAGWPDFGWKIFEMSGSAAGQELAFGLIPPSGTLAVVGFTLARLELRLSNLMALDATCFGNWGCAPRHYPEVIRMVLDGRINLKPFIQTHPLSRIQPLFEQAHHGGLPQRAILVPQPQEQP
ncbi:MAG: 6-hydroxycyclohex-1-ene-1-carbonyl-CoA dehydrogenase [Planctomycetes bacterium]|jgi:6-hydroxycyclohex-1-ene-1-carbonyl-CoA dehydrogenase|nr:6-hydroxycyclohex-1-ene-1-carbonyl-CoA dehydrogenase [Planctomycetota bacterium]MCL4729780.1 6-hydroxycyclohex-1-ene-1-carbonyl-CoA dehydrogenase [Planctomycetota bacterium]